MTNNHRQQWTNNHRQLCMNSHQQQIIIGSDGPIITGSYGQMIIGGKWAHHHFVHFLILIIVRFMLQSSQQLLRWLRIILPSQQLVSLLSVFSQNHDTSALLCEAHWRKIPLGWDYLQRHGYMMVCLRWCQRRLYDENMVIMDKNSNFVVTMYIQCIKHI